MSIADELAKIEERQRKATPGRWECDWERLEAMPVGFYVSNPNYPREGHYWIARSHGNDAEYIAAACCPVTGDVTRMLKTVRLLSEALWIADKDLAHYGGQSRNDSSRCRIADTLTAAEAELVGKDRRMSDTLKELRKLRANYNRAAGSLANARDAAFPPGCRVRSKLLDMEAIVREGSLYPDQVFTTLGHMSFTSLERIEP